MIDSVRMTVPVGVPGGVDALVARGWDDWWVGRWSVSAEGERVHRAVRWAHRGWGVGDDVVHCQWHGMEGGWLTVRASIPRLIHGENAVLATGGDWRTGLRVMRVIAADLLEVALPELDAPEAWRYSGLDPVWAWPCPPAPYLAALAVARLPGTVVTTWEGDVTWKSNRGKKRRTRARSYDKAREAGHEVELPLRLERQLTSPGKRERVVVDGRQVGCWLPMWDEAAALGVVRQMMAALGLDRPIPSKAAAVKVLRDVYGRTQADNLAGHLVLAAALGGWRYVDRPAPTVARWQRELRAAGVVGLSLEGELPPLAVPE